MGRAWLLTAVLACAAGSATGGEWSGHVGAEVRAFPHPALSSEQHDIYPGAVLELEYRERSQDGTGFTFVPFARVDRFDKERTHADVRELLWSGAGDGYELRAGIGRVYWSVMEFAHVVDIVNQTDFVEQLDGRARLGQPMLNLSRQLDGGVLSGYVLPGFRERTFPGPQGRLRTDPPVDPNRASYESSKRRAHVDWLLRWSRSGSGWDAGVYAFKGTSREPRFLPGLDEAGRVVLVPRYDQIDQLGADLQASAGKWVWKLEAIGRKGGDERFGAYSGGFEYTVVGAFGGRADVGLIAELMRDGRGDRAPNFYQDDLGVGLRVALNDAQSSQALIGVLIDRDHRTQLWKLEASRRLGDKWKLGLEARYFRDVAREDILFGMREDSYLQVDLARYF